MTFGRLRVVERAPSDGKATAWYCLCACGGEKKRVQAWDLKNGKVVSCGCFRREAVSRANTKHGHNRSSAAQSDEYRSWRALVERCTNSHHKNYKDYGGRGITVDPRWLGPAGFENFLADMGPRPKSYTIERKDNNGPYSPENCRWATRMEQGSNKRGARLVTYQGRTQCLSAWAAELGVGYMSLWHRVVRRGQSLEEVLRG
jgi:hypothetical protein